MWPQGKEGLRCTRENDQTSKQWERRDTVRRRSVKAQKNPVRDRRVERRKQVQTSEAKSEKNFMKKKKKSGVKRRQNWKSV